MAEMKFYVTPDLYASKGNRFLHYIVDLIVILLFVYGIFAAFIFLYYSVAEDTTAMDEFLYGVDTINPILDRLVTAIVLAFFYFGLESLTKGRSIGKYITKTKVVLEDGSSPNSSDYLKRSFSRMIPFEAFSFLGSDIRGWHDTISKTYVVDIERFEDKKRAQSELDQIGVVQEL
ncbi:RDD family protein [Algibacter sp. R77976]|uniref:RDD family protein n=1 Tax=Algibacter sp. R77976 TaxID=3093873 RepID=UPI0037CBC3F8